MPSIYCIVGPKVYPTFMFPNPSPPPDAVKQIPRFPKYHCQSSWWNSRIHNQTKPNQINHQPPRKRSDEKQNWDSSLNWHMWRILSNFVLSLRRISLPKSLCKISFSRTSPKAEMVLLRRHKKFKTTSQFSGFRLSNINPRSPTAKPTTTLSNPSVRRIEHPSLAMATLVKSSDLPTLSIRLIMQGKVTEKLGDPTNTMIPPFSLSTPTQPFNQPYTWSRSLPC